VIFSSVKLLIKKLIWRSRNRRNFTTVGNPGFPLNKVSVGCGTYGVLTIIAFGSELEKVNIGNYCSIADGVSILLGGEHRTSSISTFPFSSMYGGQVTAVSKGPVTIDDDVWIGYRATILSGVHIGQGAVVGACALITKDVPPYAVVGGVPANGLPPFSVPTRMLVPKLRSLGRQEACSQASYEVVRYYSSLSIAL
jgi:virginiamycin A acetyltransferase